MRKLITEMKRGVKHRVKQRYKREIVEILRSKAGEKGDILDASTSRVASLQYCASQRRATPPDSRPDDRGHRRHPHFSSVVQAPSRLLDRKRRSRLR